MNRETLTILVLLLMIVSPCLAHATTPSNNGNRTLSEIVPEGAPSLTGSRQPIQTSPTVNLTITADLEYVSESWANATVTIDGAVEGYVTGSTPFIKQLVPDRNYTIGVTPLLSQPGTCATQSAEFSHWNQTQSLSNNPITLLITEDTLLEAHYSLVLSDPPPANIRILSPRDGALLPGSRNVTVSASFGGDTRAVALSIDGREVQRYVKGNTTSTTARFTLNTSGLSWGKHELSVYVSEGCFMFDEGRHTIHVYIGSYGITPLEITLVMILPLGILFVLRRKTLKRPI